jgi:hypothetical protein
VTVGLTNQGAVGALCSSGLLNFTKGGTPAATTATLQSGSDTPCPPESGVLVPNVTPPSVLTVFGANRSVTGAIGAEFVVGHALPQGHAIIAADTFGPGGTAPFGLGLTALVERHGAVFSQANLTGDWRIVGLNGQSGFAGGSTENYFGELTFFANRSATGSLGVIAPNSFARSIFSADIAVAANGSVTGVITTVEQGDIFTDVTVNGLMTPDKAFVVGVMSSDRFEDSRHGMFFMQKDPGTTGFTPADLAGSWHAVSLQAFPADSSQGEWVAGGLSLNTVGSNVSQITAWNLTNSAGNPVFPVSDSSFLIFPNGVIAGEALLADDSLVLGAFGTMSKDKKHVVGITLFGLPGPEGEIGLELLGVFSMVKLAPPPPASSVQFSTGNYSVQEGMTAAITVTRSGATSTAVTVDYVATDPFVEGSLASGTLIFPAGTTSQKFNVPTFGDLSPDADRVIALQLTNPTNGATLGARSTANLIVLNDDSTFSFSQPTYTVSEKAGKATITVNRSGALAFPASVPFTVTAGTAIAGKDFTPISGNLSFAKNIATAKFDVIVKDNSILDGNRSVLLDLFPAVIVGAPAGARPAGVLHPTATLIITDDDTPGVVKLSSATYSGDEGKSVTITIVRAPATAGAPLGGNVSVGYFTSNNGSAIGGFDYTVTAGTVTFTGTQTTQTVSIPLAKDNLAEGPEHFLFTLGTPSSGATLGSPSVARVNINDIDKGGVVSLSASSYSVLESAGNVSITLKRTGGNAANVSVQLTTGGGTATGGVDYGNVSTTVVFGLNETTKTVVVPIFQDTDAEGNETFSVTLSNPSQGVTLGSPFTAVVTIVDDEAAIRFAQAAFDTKEGTPGKIVVVRSGSLVSQVTVPYNISSISAFPGVDFTGPVSGTLTFKPKDTQAFFMIPTVNNSKVDGNRSVSISLGTPTGGAQLGAPSTATFTIVDDDQPGVFRMGSPTYTVKEGGAVVVDIMRLPASGAGGPLGGNISISYATSSGNASAGSDFMHVAGTLVFGPLETKKSVTLQTLQDTVVDPGKNFFFTLSAPSGGATLGSPFASNILIQDDDSAGVVFLSQKSYSVRENAGNISITVMRTGGTANASVHFATMPGTATVLGDLAPIGGVSHRAESGSGLDDFGFVSTTLFFGAGETKKTVVVPIYDDGAGEGDEVFFVVLSNPQGGLKLGSPANASVTIVDDEVVIQFSGKFKNNQPEVVRTGSLSANVSVQYVATSGTAIQGEDFILPPGTLVFPPGVSSRTIPVVTVNDNIAEGTETFTITLMTPTEPAQLGPFFEQVFGLNDNDFGGTVSFSNASPTATLGESKAITITRAGGAGTVMTVGWSAISGTGVAEVDFSPASGQVTFQANQSAQTFFVNIGSSPATQGKTIVFGLMPPGLNDNPPSSKLGAVNTSTLTVLGAPPSVIQFSSATYSVTEDQGFATITVKRTGNLSQSATVHYETSDGSATASGEDYTPASGTLTFPASDGSYQHVTFNVAVTDDGQQEAPETVNLMLSNTSSNAVLGARSTAVLTISDPVPQGGYNFTVLYSGAASVGLPSINDDQGFAFSVTGDGQIVYSGNMAAPADLHTALTVPNGTVAFLSGNRFPADAGENVAFRAGFESGGTGVVVAFNNSATTVYSSGATVGEPSLSLNGTLAFKGFVPECMEGCEAVLLGDSGFVDIAVASGDTIPGVGFLGTVEPNVSVNDTGTVAFVGNAFSGARGVFTTIGDGAISVISSTVDETYVDYGAAVSINNDGTVAFIGILQDGNASIVLGYNGGTMPVATTSPGGFTSLDSSNVVLSNNGVVAFRAGFGDEGEGIFVGPDLVADKVVALGDSIGGRTVVELSLGGINSDGQVSFVATLYNGETFEDAAIVATPSAPCDCARPPLALRRP